MYERPMDQLEEVFEAKKEVMLIICSKIPQLRLLLAWSVLTDSTIEDTYILFICDLDESEKKKETSTSSLTKFLQSIKSGKAEQQDEGIYILPPR